jgi:hypothetical protein
MTLTSIGHPAGRARASLAVVLMALAAALAGCGDSSDDAKLLSRTSASDLRATLTQVQQRVSSGDCSGAQDQVGLLEQQIDSLDSRVDANLRAALVSGASRLQRLVASECAAATAETGATGPTGPTDTGGTTGLDGQQNGEHGNGKKKGQKKEKNKNKDKSGDEGGGDQTGTGTGESGGGGTTGSGGFAP